MITQQTIKRKFGNSNRVVAQVADADGVPISLVGWANFVLNVHTAGRNLGPGTLVATTSGGLVSDGTDALFYVNISSTVPIGNYLFQVHAVNGLAENITLMEGTYSIGVRL